jgi:hypothetical protein
MAQTASMLAELEAMKAENRQREMQGFSDAYGEAQFLALPDRYGIGHNAVVSFFG